MTRKTLVILAVLAIALVVLVISTDAMRGGMRGGSGGMGGSGGGISPVPDGNYDAPTSCGNYELPPGNYGPGNYDALDICVSTDKRVYVEGEPLEIEVKAYNPLDSVITLVFGTSSRDILGCQAYYTIDGLDGLPEWGVACNAAMDDIPIPPKGSHSWLFTHTESVFLVEGGRHSVVGSVGRYGQSDPITIDVLGMDGGNTGNVGNVGNIGNVGNFPPTTAPISPYFLDIKVGESKKFTYWGHDITVSYLSASPKQVVIVTFDGKEELIEVEPTLSTADVPGIYWNEEDVSFSLVPLRWEVNEDGQLLRDFGGTWDTTELHFVAQGWWSSLPPGNY
ncbi:MAG: hypothetical protein V3R93_01040 [Candidatus Hydrothermarchaeaceae archaeon]